MKTARILIILLVATASSLCATLTKTTTTITSSQNPSTYGQAVTFTAVVTSSMGAPPDGDTVEFLKGKNVLGTGTLSGGTATFTTSTLAKGTDAIKAEYTGDATYGSSTSTAVDQVVNDASTTTTLVSSLNPSGDEQSVTFTATVIPQYSGTATGNIFFYNGSKKLGGVTLSGGAAGYTTATLPVGTNTITAVYNGSSSFTGSTSNPVEQVVNTGTFIDSSLVWNGITRYYEVYLPAVLPANPPMVLMLHGTQKTTSDDAEPIITLNWGWQPVADKYKFILVKPASTYDPSSSQWNWNAYCMDGTGVEGNECYPYGSDGGAFPYAEGCGSTDSECPDDSGFLRALIKNLTDQYNVNPDMVYVAGFSSGAEMAERVGVELSDVVAAIAPASGQLVAEQGIDSPPLPLPPPPVEPISVQEWHGTKDTELPPCNYGRTSYSGVTFTLDTVDDTFNYWTGSSANSCTVFQTTQPLCLNDEPNNANDAPTPGIPGATGNIATGCTDPNVTVQFIWEPDVAHSWQTQYDTMRWTFFAAHAMSGSRKK
ncbi:MAG: Ig-like domain repeat protein [Terriglobales bacterium]